MTEYNNGAALDTQKLDMVLEGYYPQMERDLLALLAYPSVRGQAEQGAPFGRPIADALAYALAMAASLGLDTLDVDGYVGAVDLPGNTDEQIGVLAHLDVVPADASEWIQPPFEPRIADGRIYARGAADDKGPAVASLYAMVALRDCCVPLNKTVRLLLGCDEESGMSCMEHYLELHPQPSCGFSPDGEFPLIVGEKGLAHFRLSKEWPAGSQGDRPRLIMAHSGTVDNVVPSAARAELVGDAAALPELPGISVSQEGERIVLTATGAPAHASTPEQGDNALVKLVQALNTLDIQPPGAQQYIATLCRLFADPCYGEGLGIADESELGVLTCAPTVLDISPESGVLTVDMRFLFEHDGAYYRDMLGHVADENGLRFSDWDAMEPMLAGEDSPLAQTLLRVYRDYSGDMSPALIIGGGTYAKTMKDFLAFGPEKEGSPTNIHQAEESISQRELLEMAKIYARAIYELAR